MTSENRERNETSERARAHDALRSAQMLLAAGQCADAVSRAYYAAFHAASALLFRQGLQARSHAGLRNLIGLHYVTTGILGPADGRILSSLAKSREDADYGSGLVFTEAMARADVEAARRFVERTEAILGML